MASSSKKSSDSRRVKVDELRAQQKAAERKRSMIFIAIAVVVGLGLIAAAAVPLIQRNSAKNADYSEIGVSASAASCDDVIDEPTEGENNHVGDTDRVDYEVSPPSSGPHRGFTAGFERSFYGRGDTPDLEELVHNLEHGATIAFYDEDASDADVEALEVLASKLTNEDHPKFIAAAWDSEDRGEFPEGMNIALSHWSIDQGHRQYCGAVSGEVILDFADAHPYTDSPEPNGG